MRRLGCWIFFLLVACTWAASAARIVCTTTIVGDVVGRVAGGSHELTVLLPVDADPHAFEPTPQDLVAIARADIVFLSGAGLETGLEPFLENTTTPMIRLSDGLDLLHPEDPDEEEGHHDQEEDDHHHAGVDPHVWFDPTYVMSWVDRIAETLVDLDPNDEAGLRARAAAYRSELEALDAWIEEETNRLPEERRLLVTDHDVFGYLARRYDFRLVGTVLPGLSSIAEPSAREVAALEEAIVALGVPAVFVGTTVNRTLADRIASDTGTRVIALYTGSLSAEDGPAATYLDLLRFDVQTIVDALSEAAT